jgi:hypothetical protein
MPVVIRNSIPFMDGIYVLVLRWQALPSRPRSAAKQPTALTKNHQLAAIDD